jgi:hypothetical protein
VRRLTDRSGVTSKMATVNLRRLFLGVAIVAAFVTIGPLLRTVAQSAFVTTGTVSTTAATFTSPPLTTIGLQSCLVSVQANGGGSVTANVMVADQKGNAIIDPLFNSGNAFTFITNQVTSIDIRGYYQSWLSATGNTATATYIYACSSSQVGTWNMTITGGNVGINLGVGGTPLPVNAGSPASVDASNPPNLLTNCVVGCFSPIPTYSPVPTLSPSPGATGIAQPNNAIPTAAQLMCMYYIYSKSPTIQNGQSWPARCSVMGDLDVNPFANREYSMTAAVSTCTNIAQGPVWVLDLMMPISMSGTVGVYDDTSSAQCGAGNEIWSRASPTANLIDLLNYYIVPSDYLDYKFVTATPSPSVYTIGIRQ